MLLLKINTLSFISPVLMPRKKSTYCLLTASEGFEGNDTFVILLLFTSNLPPIYTSFAIDTPPATLSIPPDVKPDALSVA